jgi:transcriptional regulator with XRE-family HTH domain
MATPKDLSRDIGGFIRDLRESARISLRQLAEQAGVSNPYLSQIERGLRKPSAEVLQQIASALRVSTPAMYLRAGLLDSEGAQGVLAAIAVDPELTMAQKQSLTQIYETFRGENARTAAAATASDATTTEAAATTETAAPAPGAFVDGPAETRAAPTPQAEAGRQAEAVLDAVAAAEVGATPAPSATETTPKPAKKAAPRAAAKAAPAAEEEKK